MAIKESLVIVGTGWGDYTLLQDIDCTQFNIIISPEQTSPYTPLLCSMWTLRLHPGRGAR
ncbi:hypothetical protein FSOLCH5_010829 [Fusarium solani]